MNSSLKLDELASRAGVSPRTVRYYIQRGLLPPAEFRGPDTAYDERHLQALRAIKRLQEEYLPLDAIASALEGKSEAELRRIAEKGLGSAAKVTREEPVKKPQTRGVRGERLHLADGIELWVEEGANRTLVDALIKFAKERS